jgi:hypothetical protein
MSAKLILLVPVLYASLQWFALARMRHGWQVAAVLPAVFILAAFAVFVIGIATGASLATLWLVMGLPLATVYLLLLVPIHWVFERAV